MLFALAVTANCRGGISYPAILACLKQWTERTEHLAWGGRWGRVLKCSALIVVAQRQNQLHRFNLHRNWNRRTARCNKMRTSRAAMHTSILKGQNVYRVQKLRACWQVCRLFSPGGLDISMLCHKAGSPCSPYNFPCTPNCSHTFLIDLSHNIQSLQWTCVSAWMKNGKKTYLNQIFWCRYS